MTERLRALAERMSERADAELLQAAAEALEAAVRARRDALDEAARTAAAVARQLSNDQWYPTIDQDPHNFGWLLGTEKTGDKIAEAIRA